MDEHGSDAPEQQITSIRVFDDGRSPEVTLGPIPRRKYLHGMAELLDRLSIVLLKSIFIPEHRDSYLRERALIEHDIDLFLARSKIDALAIRAIFMLMLSNRFIWENEAKARTGGSEQDRLLKLTHSVNGSRNTARNVLAALFGERLDVKVDCFAAEFKAEFGNWDVFDANEVQQRLSQSEERREA